MATGMVNPAANSKRKPTPARVPSERAQGLEPEITAQPRPLSDDLGSLTGEDGLSVDPDDLGAHFLSEAIEQGDLSPRGAADYELSLQSGSETDAAMVGPNFESDNSLWEQTVGLAVQTAGGVDQLRASAAIAADELDAALDEEDDEEQAVSVTESHIRELSLFDREAPESGETVSPEAQTEDGGHHARSTSRDALGEQVTGARSEAPAAASSKKGGRIRRTAVSALRGARKLKHLAGKLTKSKR
jgi:hypothetical protein